MKFFLITYLLFFTSLFSMLYCQSKPAAYVDGQGIMRWSASGKEVCLFGVNYTTPFAYSYRAHKKLGLDLKKAIALDVAHLARLGLDAFRVHVWDREISDEKGNLLANEHLELFDYLLARLEEKGIKIIITPIAWWGTGWPEPDRKESGFSDRYKKIELITEPAAREAERNYLRQFLAHKNPFTQKTYKDDPGIIAMEIINEPNHPQDTALVTSYINEMAGVMRQTGFTGPIIYNISENWSVQQANAVARANIQGVSFQWYPTGLVHNSMLQGNFLPNVNAYPIPADSVQGLKDKCKIIYEFDAADIGASTMYPAIARSFRGAGMQFATAFAYDPVQIAWSNTEYPTHFVNLLYTPAKALGLLIASRAFHAIPLGATFGNYPENNSFMDFHIDYEHDFSELNSDTEFIYTNTTPTMPKEITSLRHIAGCGNSSVIRYDGTGAYFLDKVADGIWTLEIYPDVLWLRDPFEQTSMNRQVARLFFNSRSIALSLPDLGNNFVVSRSGAGTYEKISQEHGQVQLFPGKYILSAPGKNIGELSDACAKDSLKFSELYRPADNGSGIWVVNKTKAVGKENGIVAFAFQIASQQAIENASLFVRRFGWRNFREFPLINGEGFCYQAHVPGALLKAGKIEYCIAVRSRDSILSFPGDIPKNPGDWDFPVTDLWQLTVLENDGPLPLFDAEHSRKNLILPQWSNALHYQLDFVNGPAGASTAVEANITFNGKGMPFALEFPVTDFQDTAALFADYTTLVITGRARGADPCKLAVRFLLPDGNIFGAETLLHKQWAECKIPLAQFKTSEALILPQPYPHFFPIMRKSAHALPLNAEALKGGSFLQLAVDDPAGADHDGKANIIFQVERVYLTK